MKIEITIKELQFFIAGVIAGILILQTNINSLVLMYIIVLAIIATVFIRCNEKADK